MSVASQYTRYYLTQLRGDVQLGAAVLAHPA